LAKLKIKLFRIATIPLSLNLLLKGQLRYFSNFYDVTAISGPGIDLDEVKTREGVRIKPIEIKRKISVINDLVSLFCLFIYFKKEKPLIVHSITPKAGLLSMLAGKLAGVPIRIHTFTGLIFPTKTGIIKKVLTFADKLLCWASTNIYAEGKGVKSDLIKYKITRKNPKIIANGNINGIDSNYFCSSNIDEITKTKLRQHLDISPSDFVFLYVGRLVGDKGVNELISAFLSLNLSSTRLVLLGSFEHNLDPLSSETLKAIAGNANIICPGFQIDVRPYYAISNVFVLPSYREGFPNALLQAGAMGLPSIVTNINGSNEIIVNGVNGLIVPVKNIQFLKNSMLELFANENYRSSLSRNAREIIVSLYDNSLVWDGIKNEYDQLISDHNIL
jgi:glycosyltransferase involved in cell wall biosynthesis